MLAKLKAVLPRPFSVLTLFLPVYKPLILVLLDTMWEAVLWLNPSPLYFTMCRFFGNFFKFLGGLQQYILIRGTQGELAWKKAAVCMCLSPHSGKHKNWEMLCGGKKMTNVVHPVLCVNRASCLVMPLAE